jgi:hypothetical protein
LRLSPHVVCLALLAVVALGACGKHEKSPVQPDPIVGQVPDFSLIDVNPNSATHGVAISPRGQLGKISAWYFGHAT